MNEDFDSIILTLNERWILFSLRFVKNRKGNIRNPSLIQLFKYDLIQENHLVSRDQEGGYIPDGTYSLTEKAKRYRIYICKQKFHRYITPFTVSAITTTGLYMLEHWLLPVLLSWIQDHF